MTASQLIEKLSELLPETEVFLWTTYSRDEAWMAEVTDVETEPVSGMAVLS